MIPSTKSGQHGLTLVELMVAMVCMLIVMGAVYDLFTRQSKLTLSEESIIDMQDNARVAMERLAFVFSHAGYGCIDDFRDGQTMTGEDPATSNSTTISAMFSNMVDNAASGTSPDSVVVTFGFTKSTDVNGDVDDSTALDLYSDQSPQVNNPANQFKNYLTFFPIVQANSFYTVTGSGTSFTMDREATIAHGTDVYMVSPVRVQLGGTNGTTLQLQNFAYTTTSDWDVAECIQDLQIEYATNGTNWSGTVSNGNDVMGVRYAILARASKPERDYTNTNTYDLLGTTVGPFNDSYRRMVSQRTVWVKNN